MRQLAPFALLLAGGCFQVVEVPTCGDVSRTEVLDDEATPAGTATELRDRVAMDALLPGSYWDGHPVEVDIVIEQDGPAVWVEQEVVTEKKRSFGFGREMALLAAYCPNQLELPLFAEAHTADEAVDVVAVGTAFLGDPDSDGGFGVAGVPLVDLTGSYADATFTVSEEDPAEWTDKYSFVSLDFDEDGLREGAVGWGGQQETEDAKSSMIDRVVTFSALPSGTPTDTVP